MVALMPIPFTQFLRPDGRRTIVTIDRPAHIEDMAKVIIDSGGRFTVEALVPFRDVSFVVEYNDADLCAQVCQNGPAVLEAVDALVSEAFTLITGLAPAEPPP
jgi:hypothetical protein